MHDRRDTLKQSLAVAGLLATAGLLPRQAAAFTKAAFDARNLAEAAKAFGGGAPSESAGVMLTAPEISENGASVPLGVACTLAGVRCLLLLVEKNPSPLVAKFDVSDSVEASFSIRAKMAQSSDVYAVAITHEGRTFFAKKDVKVTLGGCAA